MQATITIQQALTASQLTIYSQSGPGGQGGNGGQGGPGQQGGNGGSGVTCECTGNADGQGGDGGPARSSQELVLDSGTSSCEEGGAGRQRRRSSRSGPTSVIAVVSD